MTRQDVEEIMASRSDVQILAATIWAEGREDGIMAMAALATMVKNRLRYAPHRHGCCWRDVCRHLPCWQIEADGQRSEGLAAIMAGPDGDRWQQALTVAELVMELPVGDVSRGATAYCRETETIGWKGRETARVGGLRFYREETREEGVA